jgi:hypothetical protein
MEIPEASDLDNFKAVGDYFCGTSQRAQTLYNCPTTSSFMLEVRPTNAGENKTNPAAARLQQRIWTNKPTPNEYRRTWNGSAWASWYEVVMQPVSSI